MAQPTYISNDVVIGGSTVFVGPVTLPAATVADAAIAAAAKISASKLQHRHSLNYQQAAGADIATATIPLFIARKAGSILAIEVAAHTAPTGGDKQFTVDLQAGNQSTAFATVLSAVVTYSSTQADREVEVGTISTPALAIADQLRLVVTASGSTGSQGQGLAITVTVDEDPN